MTDYNKRKATEELRRLWKKDQKRTRKLECALAEKKNDLWASMDSHKNQLIPQKSLPPKILSLSQGAAACVQRIPDPRPKDFFRLDRNEKFIFPSSKHALLSQTKDEPKLTYPNTLFYDASNITEDKKKRKFYFISPEWNSENMTLRKIAKNHSVK